jgi:hypothetical protein
MVEQLEVALEEGVGLRDSSLAAALPRKCGVPGVGVAGIEPATCAARKQEMNPS